jgi:hypothetical protein
VAVSGTTVVVGASGLFGGIPEAAYVFVKSGNGWPQVAELTDGMASDGFGYSVAIADDTIVVAAGGAAYVFVEPAGGWQDMLPTAALTIPNVGESKFADAVAISSDGTTIAAGAEGDGGLGSGAAYVFVKPAGGWQNTSAPTATLSSTAATDLGSAVAISGNVIVAGSIGVNEQGAAYVFVRPAGGWRDAQPNATLTPSDGFSVDHFGTSVAIGGNTVVVGAPFHPLGMPGTAYVFVQPPGGWKNMTQTAELTVPVGHTLLLGQAVAVEDNVILAGAPDDPIGHSNMQGAVFGYVKPPSGWVNSSTPEGSVTSSDGAARDLFGDAIAVSGNVAVIGAPHHAVNGNGDAGAAYVFGEQ